MSVNLLHGFGRFILQIGRTGCSEELERLVEAMAGLLAVFSESEREILSERIKAGIAQARREGRRLGRPPTAARKAEKVQQLHAHSAERPINL